MKKVRNPGPGIRNLPRGIQNPRASYFLDSLIWGESHNYCCQIKIEQMVGNLIVASSKAIIATSNSSELTIGEAHQ